MRVQVGRTLRVGPGDEVVIRGRLPETGKLGRLLVFASENGAEFSPYVPHVADMLVANGRPVMLTPLSMRLGGAGCKCQISFVADISGAIRIMQEVDGPDDPRVVVELSRTINPNLGWLARLQRRFMPWRMMTSTS